MKYFRMRSLWFALVFFAVALSSQCSKKSNHEDHSKHLMDRGELSGASLYQIHEKFSDQNGKELMLHQFSGKYVVLSMFYSTCKSICPRIAADMRSIESKLSDEQKKNTVFVLISVDHERDKSTGLKDFAARMHLSENFTLLSGAAGSIREVAAALGISYKKLPDGEYAHSAIITLLSKQGEILEQLNGIGQNTQTLLSKIK